MSGPKSVRYVSLEELLATCQALLEGYRSLSASWLNRGERGELSENGDEEFVAKVLCELDKLLADQDTSIFQKRIMEETAWLEREFDRRVEAKAIRVRIEQQSARRRVSAASTVLDASLKKPGTVPQDIIDILESVKKGDETNQSVINHAVAAAFDVLTLNQKKTGMMAEHRELADRLGVGERRSTIKDWLDEASPEDEESGSKVDQIIAELMARFGREKTAPFRKRADAMASEADPHRRKLLMDSLSIEMAGFAREEAVRERLLSEGRGILACLFVDKETFAEEIEKLQSSLERGGGQSLKIAIEVARSAQERHFAKVYLANRRRTLLDALGKLGYQIEEGMETAFARDGRIVIERTERQGYGVELAGLVANDKLQVRATRFNDTLVETSIDLEHETEWCSTFSDLRAVLGESGDEIIIDKALSIGEKPLKVVERVRRRRSIQSAQRTLD